MLVRKEFRRLITREEAQKIIQSLDIKPRPIEVSIENACGHTLAEDVISETDVPPFTRASMDGYAVFASDTYAAREDRPVRLKLIGSIQAGVNPDISLKRCETADIATGAVLPEGADSVVMVEYTLASRPYGL